MDSLVLPRELFSAQVPQAHRELILRMLSIRPEQRGTAGQLASALERAADALTRFPSFPSASGTEPPAVRPTGAPARRPRASAATRPVWIAAAVLAGVVAMWEGWRTRAAFRPADEASPRASEVAHSSGPPGAPEREVVGLGEEAVSLPQLLAPLPAVEKAVADSLPELSEGQAQPDKKGRCPRPQQVVLNGGCWGRTLKMSPEECDNLGGQMYQQACYLPAFPAKPGRPSTSDERRPRHQ